MTLPFENDTSRIVKKYAKHSISQSRVKTFLSVLTIALAVALLSGFALSVIGMETEAKRGLLMSSHAWVRISAISHRVIPLLFAAVR